jgi:hypothetical protein
MNRFKPRARTDSEMELDRRAADRMRESGHWVVADAREYVLRLDPVLAASIDQITKRKTTSK